LAENIWVVFCPSSFVSLLMTGASPSGTLREGYAYDSLLMSVKPFGRCFGGETPKTAMPQHRNCLTLRPYWSINSLSWINLN
jgi:hypothetical protein